jgi:hypothetical protein
MSFNVIGIIPQVLWSYRLVFGVMALGYVMHWVPEKLETGDCSMDFTRTPLWAKVLITVVMVFIHLPELVGRPAALHLFPVLNWICKPIH